MFENSNFEIFYGDAIEMMKLIPDSYVDLICVDLPYGTTQNKWDVIIPFNLMWEQFKRIRKPNTAMVFTASQPFSSMLTMSNLEEFKYEIIWQKTVGSGQLNIKHQPLKIHENILVFYDKIPTYNEQMNIGKPYSIKRKAKYTEEGNYGLQKPSEKISDGLRHARSVIEVSNPRIKNGHPTQKPVNLMTNLIKTYSNKGDIVLDCCMGSGTTGVACGLNNRKFIGIENNEAYFELSGKRIEQAYIFY